MADDSYGKETCVDTRQLARGALFVALIAVGAFIRIPIPVIPFTLQTLFVMLAGMLLGKNMGALSCLVYMLLGLFGVPVFTSGGGFGYVLQPTFGYLVGFVIGAYVTGAVAHGGEKVTYRRLLVAAFAGLAVIYAVGVAYLYLISNLYLGKAVTVWYALLYGFLITLPGDVAKALVAGYLALKVLPVIGTQGKAARKGAA
jgi:biotin transport system substrate-specific component